MGQTFYDDTYEGGHVAASDLQNIETNFATLKSQFSGASAPASPVDGMPFMDTTKNILKTRVNGSWRGQFHGDASQKVLVYRNSAMDGYLIDTTLTSDRVVAVKNHGSGTYTTAGVAAGSWNHATGLSSGNESAHTHQHNHQWYYRDGSDQNDKLYDSAGTGVELYFAFDRNKDATRWRIQRDLVATSSGSTTIGLDHSHTDNDSTAGSAHNHSISSNSTWRPYAYVFTIQYPNL